MTLKVLETLSLSPKEKEKQKEKEEAEERERETKRDRDKERERILCEFAWCGQLPDPSRSEFCIRSWGY